MKAIRKRKTSRSKFEGELIDRHGVDNFHACRTSERNVDEHGEMVEIPLTLYYFNEPSLHMATWCKGKGWEFE